MTTRPYCAGFARQYRQDPGSLSDTIRSWFERIALTDRLFVLLKAHDDENSAFRDYELTLDNLHSFIHSYLEPLRKRHGLIVTDSGSLRFHDHGWLKTDWKVEPIIFGEALLHALANGELSDDQEHELIEVLDEYGTPSSLALRFAPSLRSALLHNDPEHIECDELTDPQDHLNMNWALQGHWLFYAHVRTLGVLTHDRILDPDEDLRQNFDHLKDAYTSELSMEGVKRYYNQFQDELSFPLDYPDGKREVCYDGEWYDSAARMKPTVTGLAMAHKALMGDRALKGLFAKAAEEQYTKRFILSMLGFPYIAEHRTDRRYTDRDRANRSAFGDDDDETMEGYIGDLDEAMRTIRDGDYPMRVKKRAKREYEEESKYALPVLNEFIRLPWNTRQTDLPDYTLSEARTFLDESHYGLTEVKERIAEQLVAWQQVPGLRAPNLCLVGPPGVGKTSIARNIARMIERPFQSVPIGGVSLPGDIQGDHRTYNGASIGRIAEGLREAGSMSPLMLLDEIDKLSNSRHRPESALVALLDPDQNDAFFEHFLRIELDLSDVFFVATANQRSFPKPLENRMEIIRLPGYERSEKVAIAQDYLLPDLCDQYETTLSLSDDTIVEIIDRFTAGEDGVRTLRSRLEDLVRKRAVNRLNGQKPTDVLKRGTNDQSVGF